MHHNGDNVVFACFVCVFYYFLSSSFAMVSDIFRKDDCCVFLFIVDFILFYFYFQFLKSLLLSLLSLLL